jgi:hypothetical protein
MYFLSVASADSIFLMFWASCNLKFIEKLVYTDTHKVRDFFKSQSLVSALLVEASKSMRICTGSIYRKNDL